MNTHPIYIALMKRNLNGLADRIAAEHNVTIDELLSDRRMRHFCAARAELWRTLYDRGWSYPAIGSLFNRDHTSIIAALRKDAERRSLPPPKRPYTASETP